MRNYTKINIELGPCTYATNKSNALYVGVYGVDFLYDGETPTATATPDGVLLGTCTKASGSTEFASLEVDVTGTDYLLLKFANTDTAYNIICRIFAE